MYNLRSKSSAFFSFNSASTKFISLSAAFAASLLLNTSYLLPGAAAAQQSSGAPVKAPAAGSVQGTAPVDGAAGAAEEKMEPAHSFYSPALEQALKTYKAAASTQNYGLLLSALKTLLSATPNLRISPATILKDNPFLSDFKPQVFEGSGGLRIWSFPKAADNSRLLLQWTELHQQVLGSGRRKRVVNSASTHFQELSLSRALSLKDAAVISLKDSGKFLILSGDSEEGALSLRVFKMSESGWQENSEFLAQIPAFLLDKVSGRLSFRGQDLIFNIGKMIETTDSTGQQRFLPEAESATYKFWLKYTAEGYQLSNGLIDEDAFLVVFQFMKAVTAGKVDQEKSLILDPRMSSLPKYLGLQGKALDGNVRVLQMSMPAGRGQRFRLINIGKDDLIFDVAKVKNQGQVRAIFVAAPDPFLEQTAKYFPLYSQLQQKLEQLEKEKTIDAQATQVNGTAGANSGKR